jgi:hypothetical protein
MRWLNNFQDIPQPDVERTEEEDKDSPQPSPQSGRRPGDDGMGPRHRFGINLVPTGQFGSSGPGRHKPPILCAPQLNPSPKP